MPHRFALGALCVSTVMCLPHASAAPPIQLPDFEVAGRLVPEDPLPERQTLWAHPGTTLTDVVYSTLPGYRPLHLDLYRRTSAAGAQPLVVFLHGGAFGYANPRAGAAFRNFPLILAALAERGYVVASVSYRFSGEARMPSLFEDVQAAIRFLRSNATHFGIDGTRVGLWGMSAGAYLAGMQALNCVEGTCVQGWVGWFGLYDFAGVALEGADERRFWGCEADGCSSQTLAALSPIRYADAKDPPTLLVHGTADEPAVSERLAARLREVGAPVQLLLIPGVSHGLVGPTDAATKAALGQGLTATFSFFDRVLRAGGTADHGVP